MADRKQKRQTIALSIASPFGSMISRFINHPIDTIKAKLQVSRTQMKNISSIKFGTATQVIKKTYQAEGLHGFFRGVTISVFGSSIAFACYINVYQESKKVMKNIQFFKRYQTMSHLVSGFLAEMISCAFWLPIDVIKERLQVQSQFNLYKYNGPLDAAKKIKFSEGFVGLYRAYGATLMFFGPFSAILFASYQKIKDLVLKDRQKPTLSESIICSAAASGIAGYITTPLQIVKLRMQVQRADVANHGGTLEQSAFGYRNAFHGLSLILKNEGFYALYKGGLMRICYTIPVVTVTFSLTQYFKQKILESELIERFI